MKDAQLCLSDEQITEAQNILIDKLIDLNRRGYEITELNVQEKLMNLLIRNKSNICTSRGCMGGTKMIAFDQNGRIYPCDITDYKEESIGDVHARGDLIELVRTAKNKNGISLRRNIVRIATNVHSGSFAKAVVQLPSSTKLGKLKGLTTKSV